jgi:sirohydrochlorin cobaltochelatase
MDTRTSSHNAASQRAILLAAFGSRLPDATAALERMRQRAEAEFPDYRVETALTSGTVRRHKCKQGCVEDSPEDVLRRLRCEGVRQLAVQSLHVIPGDEFRNLERVALSLQGGAEGFESIAVGRPLLGNREDIRQVAGALLTVLPPERQAGEAVLLMGHGTRGRANGVYADLADELRLLDPLVLIGALEAEPGLSTKVGELRGLGVAKVHLMPLLFARGVHATRDMAGSGGNSWKTGLRNAGFACEAYIKGAGEHGVLADIWLEHLREAVARLAPEPAA